MNRRAGRCGRSRLRSWRHEDGRSLGRRWVTFMKDMLHVLGEVMAINNIVIRCSSLPQHDTTEKIRVQIHVDLHKWVNLCWSQVKTIPSSTFRSGQANKELCVGISTVLNHFGPLCEVEEASSLHEVHRRATCSVVPLDPDKVKL